MSTASLCKLELPPTQQFCWLPSTSIQPHPSTSFLGLPLEIRQLIYDEILYDRFHSALKFTRTTKGCRPACRGLPGKDLLNLLVLNQQIHADLKAYAFDKPRILDFDENVNAQDIYDCLMEFPETCLSAIRSISFPDQAFDAKTLVCSIWLNIVNFIESKLRLDHVVIFLPADPECVAKLARKGYEKPNRKTGGMLQIIERMAMQRAKEKMGCYWYPGARRLVRLLDVGLIRSAIYFEHVAIDFAQDGEGFVLDNIRQLLSPFVNGEDEGGEELAQRVAKDFMANYVPTTEWLCRKKRRLSICEYFVEREPQNLDVGIGEASSSGCWFYLACAGNVGSDDVVLRFDSDTRRFQIESLGCSER